jgi:hypothetical protein
MGKVEGSRLVRRSILALAVPLLGCATGTPPVAPTTPAPAATTDATQAQGVPRLGVESSRVLLDDQPIAPLHRTRKVSLVKPLFDAMKSRRVPPHDRDPRGPYALVVADDVEGAQLKSAFQTAAFSGWRVAKLDLGDSSIALHALVPTPPNAPTAYDLHWPNETLVLVVRSDSVELWRAKLARAAESRSVAAPPEPAGAPSTKAPSEEPPRSIGTISKDKVAAGLPDLLLEACGPGSECSPTLLYLADDASFSLVRSTLRALRALPSEQEPIVQLRLGTPGDPGKPPLARIGATVVSGRLPPEVIQQTVRDNFSGFRHCYEMGLARDANLEGRITVRFVIGRDGLVQQAIATDETTMPDPDVTECVVARFRHIVFPPPEGGIVTVVYPIMLAPG